MKLILKARGALSRVISRKLLPDSFTIISDDCWGGQLYRQLRMRYTTPTVGLYIEPKEYLNFLENIFNKNKPIFEFLETDNNFPVACLYPNSTVYFMHYHSINEAKEKFTRRYQRINWNRLLVKIDFGSPEYSASDIEKWNKMKIKNSVAFYSSTTNLPDSGVFNGVLIVDWVPDGAQMFNLTRQYFDIFSWINTGNISNGIMYKILNLFLLDPSAPKRIKNKVVKFISTH